MDRPAHSLSVTEASKRGIASLLKDTEAGTDTVVERHGRPVAAVVSIEHFGELQALERDLRSAALVFSRLATDNGVRHDLDEVITAFGFSRAELEADIRNEAAAEER